MPRRHESSYDKLRRLFEGARALVWQDEDSKLRPIAGILGGELYDEVFFIYDFLPEALERRMSGRMSLAKLLEDNIGYVENRLTESERTLAKAYQIIRRSHPELLPKKGLKPA